MDPERRSQLLQGKLRALATEQFGTSALESVPYFGGTAAIDTATLRVFVLVEAAMVERDPLDIDMVGPRPARGWLGGAIVVAARRGATELHLLGDGSLLTADDARRAARCSIPTQCWSVVGRTVEAVDPADVPAVTDDSLDGLPADERPFAAVITGAGAVPVVEHGVLRAEVLGLEVARVQRDPDTDRPHLAVGVGKHDRLAQSMMNSAVDPAVALAEAVRSVLVHRRPGAPSHPANTVARARWLREMIIAEPERFGFSGPCVRVSSTVPTDLKAAGVAGLTAFVDDAGHHIPVLVGCIAGVDLDGPTDALDTAAVVNVERVVLAVSAADDLPALRVVCATLTPTPGVVPVGAPFAEAE